MDKPGLNALLCFRYAPEVLFDGMMALQPSDRHVSELPLEFKSSSSTTLSLVDRESCPLP